MILENRSRITVTIRQNPRTLTLVPLQRGFSSFRFQRKGVHKGYHMEAIYKFLDKNEIEYQRYDHPPVYTVEDVKQVTPDIPGSKTKNLFLRDKKGARHLLVSVPAAKRVDLKMLTKVIGATRLSFGSPDRLKKYLGIDPGAVSILAIINDPDKAVEVFVDKALWGAEAYQYHPLVNTSTLAIKHDHLKRFLEKIGHDVHIIEVPSLE